MTKLIQFLVLLLLPFSLFAQNMELGKVSVAELKEKVHSTDSSAVAAVLFKKGKTYFELTPDGKWELVTEVETRIKIYKKEGLKYSNFEVPYYVGGGGSEEHVSFYNANTFNLVDGKIVKTKLKSEGEFKEQINKKWNVRKMTLPAVKEGSVIEFRYKLKSPYITNINDFSFQEAIPVNHVEYEVLIPEYFSYNTMLLGFNVIQQNSEIATTLKGFSERRMDYYGSSIPALKEESYVSNIKNYASILKFELASISYPNQMKKSYASNWDDIAKNIYEDEDFGTELKQSSYFEVDIDPLVSKALTKDEKISIVFDFVKALMTWNQKNGYNCEKGVKKAYKEKVGNVAEINLMLVAMLRHIGLNANPVILSTRANGIAPFPSRTAFNYVIAAVEIENGLILLDATSKNALPNILPLRDLNWNGRIIRKNGSSAEVDLMAKMNSKDVVNMMATITKEGTLEGKMKEQYLDYNAFSFREKYSGVATESYLEMLEKRLNNIEIGDYELTNKTELAKPAIESYSFKHNNSVEVIGDKMYFSPMLFLAMTQNPFKQETRKYPIDFLYPNQDKYLINITIPEGYAVESLPAAMAMNISDNLGGFKYMISNTGQQIQLMVTLDINSSIVSSEYYDELKEFYALMIKKQTEKIVLKKV